MSDLEAITATIRDYIDGWYQGDTARMERCLHHDLVKRILAAEGSDGELRAVTKSRMVDLTAAGGGKDPDATSEIVVHHISGDIATAQVLSPEYLDYLHLVRTPDGWRIANILFETREGQD